MRVALFAVTLFLAAFFVHWLLWHIRLPKRHTATLLVVFMGSLAVAIVLGAWVGDDAFWPQGFWEWAQVAVFHVAVSLAYIVLYSGLEENSPSLTIYAFVAEAGGQGRVVDDVYGIITDDMFIHSRMRAMVRDGLLCERDGAFHLTPKGVVWARVFGVARSILSMNKGG